MSFRLVTDGTCDLSHAVALERDIPVIPFKVSVGNEDFRPYNGDPGLKNTFSIGEFYARMRAQENTHTSQINPEDYIRYFTPMLEAGEDVLYLAFSSGLSGSCQNAMLAARELEEKYPGRRLEVVDTLCASLGEGLLVWLVDDQRKSGASLDQARDYALALRKRIVHAFTVDDLNFLRRGGRLSGAAAVLGTMLSIKPILDVNAEGKLAVFDKVQGRKRALKALVDRHGSLHPQAGRLSRVHYLRRLPGRRAAPGGHGARALPRGNRAHERHGPHHRRPRWPRHARTGVRERRGEKIIHLKFQIARGDGFLPRAMVFENLTRAPIDKGQGRQYNILVC